MNYRKKVKMSNRNLLSSTKYNKIIDIILDKRQYNEHNLMELIKSIFMLMRIDETNRQITIRAIKSKVNSRIYMKISDLTFYTNFSIF